MPFERKKEKTKNMYKTDLQEMSATFSKLKNKYKNIFNVFVKQETKFILESLISPKSENNKIYKKENFF